MTASSRLHNAPALPADLPLIVRGLRVGRGQKVLLDDMNWQIAAGQAILITGPNGTGKTSLLRT
ncbi:MAG: ATP-binding cassette domain-containing protein, partial [Candidatus Puniceispirillaceae bacterium]